MGGARDGPPSAFLAPATGPGAATLELELELGVRLIAGGSEILAADEEKECYGDWYIPGWRPKDVAGGPRGPICPEAGRSPGRPGQRIVLHLVDSWT